MKCVYFIIDTDTESIIQYYLVINILPITQPAIRFRLAILFGPAVPLLIFQVEHGAPVVYKACRIQTVKVNANSAKFFLGRGQDITIIAAIGSHKIAIVIAA